MLFGRPEALLRRALTPVGALRNVRLSSGVPFSKQRMERLKQRPRLDWRSMNGPELEARLLRVAERHARQLGVVRELELFDAAAKAYPNPPKIVVATLLERPAVVMRDVEAWESDFLSLALASRVAQSKPYPAAVLDMLQVSASSSAASTAKAADAEGKAGKDSKGGRARKEAGPSSSSPAAAATAAGKASAASAGGAPGAAASAAALGSAAGPSAPAAPDAAAPAAAAAAAAPTPAAGAAAGAAAVSGKREKDKEKRGGKPAPAAAPAAAATASSSSSSSTPLGALAAFYGGADASSGQGDDAGGGGGAGVALAPRVTQADRIGDTRSLDRGYTHRLLLLVRDKEASSSSSSSSSSSLPAAPVVPAGALESLAIGAGRWGLPRGEALPGENLVLAAERVLHGLFGDPALDAWFVGAAPVGHWLRPYAADKAAALGCVGERVFVFRAEILAGRFRLPAAAGAASTPAGGADSRAGRPFPFDDFAWLTRDESESVLDRASFKYLHQVAGAGPGEELARRSLWLSRIAAKGLSPAQATGRRRHHEARMRRDGLRIPAIASGADALAAAAPWRLAASPVSPVEASPLSLSPPPSAPVQAAAEEASAAAVAGGAAIAPAASSTLPLPAAEADLVAAKREGLLAAVARHRAAAAAQRSVAASTSRALATPPLHVRMRAALEAQAAISQQQQQPTQRAPLAAA